jgi:hypothetical protein
MLSTANFHPRDEFISFEEGPHIYTVCGERGTFTSVTTFVHKQFPHFDQEGVVNNILKGRKMNDPTYKYYGMTKEQILKSWADNGATASGAGTKMHYDIECDSNGLVVDNDSVEYKYYMNFRKDFAKLKPYRTEWMVYYEECKLSGSIDMVYRDEETGKFYIYDWKRSKEIKYDDQYCDYATNKILKGVPNLNFWHYSLQLGIYKKILQDKYGLTIDGMFLVVLHPDQSNYERIEVAPLDDEINNLFQERRQNIEK